VRSARRSRLYRDRSEAETLAPGAARDVTVNGSLGGDFPGWSAILTGRGVASGDHILSYVYRALYWFIKITGEATGARANRRKLANCPGAVQRTLGTVSA